MKVLVLGCNGMAGHMISLYMKDRGYDVTGFARKASPFIETITGDARDEDSLVRIIYGGRYDLIINCIGVLNAAAEADQENATFLNAYLPHLLARLAKEAGSYFVHISTDCVFSGKKGSYRDTDFRDGDSFYDRSKALGEVNEEGALTIRTSIVGPELNSHGIGLLNWFLQQEGPVHGYSQVFWTGQTTLQLAKTIEKAYQLQTQGLVQAVPNEKISKCDLLQLFNGHIRRLPIDILPNENVVADKSLIPTDYAYFPYEIPSYEPMIQELGDWMRVHKDLYPQYDL